MLKVHILDRCQYCNETAQLLQEVSELVKQGAIGKLTVINVMAHPELAAQYGVRAAPWLRLGPFTLTSAQTPAQLQQWTAWASDEQGQLHYLEHLFKEGDLRGAETFVAETPQRLALLLATIANPEEAITVRLGLQQGIELPNLFARGSDFFGEVAKFPPGVLQGLAARGLDVKAGRGEESGLHGVVLRAGGRLEGAADPRREGAWKAN